MHLLKHSPCQLVVPKSWTLPSFMPTMKPTFPLSLGTTTNLSNFSPVLLTYVYYFICLCLLCSAPIQLLTSPSFSFLPAQRPFVTTFGLLQFILSLYFLLHFSLDFSSFPPLLLYHLFYD